jgi:hypothetical protein
MENPFKYGGVVTGKMILYGILLLQGKIAGVDVSNQICLSDI